MRTVTGIRADLERLQETLDRLGAHGESPTVALMRSGLAEVHGDLTEQLKDAQRGRMDVVIEGGPVLDHEIRVDALARLVHALQESVSAVAQALTGKATSRAAIPGPLRDATAFHLASVFPGSFGVTLRGPADVADHDTLFVIDGATLLEQAVDAVLSVIELAGRSDQGDEPIVEAVLPFGERAFKHLSDLSSTVVAHDMSTRFSWSSGAGKSRVVDMTQVVARRLDDVLGRNKLTEEQVVIEGRLGTASDIRNRVELQTPDRIVPAKVVDELVPDLAAYFTKHVHATFQVTTIRSQVTGAERRSFMLVGLALTVEAPPGAPQ